MAVRAYRPYRSSLKVVSRLASPEDARHEFDRIVSSVDERIAELARVVGPEGITLNLTAESLWPLEAWFLSSLAADSVRPGRLSALWYAISHDIGLYVGETLIHLAPAYRWTFAKQPESPYFQRCVVSGVTDQQGEPWEWDPGQTVGNLGHQKIEGFRLASPFLEPMVAELVEYANERGRTR